MNGGLQLFPPSLAEDSLAAKRTETAILTFGGEPRLAQDFATLSNLRIPHLTAGGGTPMSAAIIRGLELIEKRKAIYLKNRIKCYTPWIFLLTDGAPTDPELWPQAVNRVKAGLARDEFQLLGVGVGKDADMAKLEELTPKPTGHALQGLGFSSATSFGLFPPFRSNGRNRSPGKGSPWRDRTVSSSRTEAAHARSVG